MGYKLTGVYIRPNGTEQKIRPTTRLPSEYQEVEYIESSGSQYIDTGWNPDGTCEIEFTFMPLSGTGTGIFGVDSGWTRIAFSVFTDRIFCYGSQYQSQATYFLSDIKYKVTFHNLTCKVDDVTRFTYNSETFTSSYSAYLFAKRRNNYVETYAKEKVYSLKLWRGNILERDFVPCYRKADSVIGMYDLVNDVFYTNSGSGTFTKGPNV